MLNIMKKLFVAMATAALIVMMAIAMACTPAFAADSLTININGSNNNVTIFGDGTASQQAPTLPSIPTNARKVNIWANGFMTAYGFIVEDTVYLASYEDVHRVFPSETRNWQSVTVQEATPLSMWADSFGYTFKVEANNVFLFKNGVADNSGELVVAKPAVVYVDGKRINVTVYLSDEDATVYAGLAELQEIFVANAAKISCSEVAQYTVNYWARKFGYTMAIEENVVMLTKQTASTPEPTQAPSQTPTPKPTATPTPTPAPVQTATPTPTPATSFTAKTYKVVVENTATNYTAKSKLVNGKEKVYVSKANANKVLKQYGKGTVSKATEVKTLAKKCGVTCTIKGKYIYFNGKKNPAVEIRYNGKVWSAGGKVQRKNGVYFASADIIRLMLGTSINWNAETGNIVVLKNNKTLQFTVGSKVYFNTKGAKARLKVAPYTVKDASGYKLMLPVSTVAKAFGHKVSTAKKNGVFVISIANK